MSNQAQVLVRKGSDTHFLCTGGTEFDDCFVDLEAVKMIEGCYVFEAERSSSSMIRAATIELPRKSFVEWELNSRWLGDYAEIHSYGHKGLALRSFLFALYDRLRPEFGGMACFFQLGPQLDVWVTFFAIRDERDLEKHCDALTANSKLFKGMWLFNYEFSPEGDFLERKGLEMVEIVAWPEQ